MHDPKQPDFSLIIASAVHDMKNSLGMLLHSVDMMCEGLPDDWKQHHDTATVQYEAERVNSYLIQLLGIYRLHDKNLSLHIDEHYLDDLLEEQSAHYQGMMQAKKVSLSINVDSDLAWFFDREIIMGVLNNALNNASRYTEKEIEISAFVEDNFLVISVQDDGKGYPKAMLDANPDEILNNISFSTGSTSLGIYFAAMVTQLHTQADRCGYIKLSNGGKFGGGVFSIYLP